MIVPEAPAIRGRPPLSAKAPAAIDSATRVQQIVELIDHCNLAKDTADRLGETFLSYLLAMTIQESRSALRRSNKP